MTRLSAFILLTALCLSGGMASGDVANGRLGDDRPGWSVTAQASDYPDDTADEDEEAADEGDEVAAGDGIGGDDADASGGDGDNADAADGDDTASDETGNGAGEAAGSTAAEEPDPETEEMPRQARDVGVWGEPVQSATRRWTVLIYLDGDNDLEENALEDMREMRQGIAAAKPGTVDVVVLFDRAKGYSREDGDWTETRVYHLGASGGKPVRGAEPLYNCGELDLSSPDTLENFVREGMRMFPAPRTALFLWNHGGGWAELINDEDAPGAAEESPSMTLEGVRKALSRAAVAFPSGKLDLLVFDMCLMGQAEVLVALAPFASYMVASPPLAPGDGLDYEQGIVQFGKNLSTADTAKGLVAAALAWYRANDNPSASFAAYDLSNITGLLTSFGALSRRLDTLIPVIWPQMTRSLFHTGHFGSRADLTPEAKTVSSIDIIDWFGRLRQVADPAQAATWSDDLQAVEQALAKLVIHCESGEEVAFSHGLALYAPMRRANLDEDYFTNSFGVYTDWAQLLTDLHREQEDNAGVPPVIAEVAVGRDAGENGAAAEKELAPLEEWVSSGEDDADAPAIKITVNGTNILWVNEIYTLSVTADPEGEYVPVWRQDISNSRIFSASGADAGLSAFDETIPVFKDGQNIFLYDAAFALTVLRGAEDAAPVYLQHDITSNNSQVEVDGEAMPEGESAWIPVVAKFQNNKLLSVMTRDDDPAGRKFISELKIGANGFFRPLFPVYRDDLPVGKRYGRGIRWGNSPTLEPRRLPENHYLKVGVKAESLAGLGAAGFSAGIRVGLCEGKEFDWEGGFGNEAAEP